MESPTGKSVIPPKLVPYLIAFSVVVATLLPQLPAPYQGYASALLGILSALGAASPGLRRSVPLAPITDEDKALAVLSKKVDP